MDTISVRDTGTLGVPEALPELPEPPEWYRLAACRGRDLAWFFPERGYDAPAYVKAAKSICAECPVREPCLELALAEGLKGVWGGSSEEERRELRRQRPAA